jgi:hypothetical protein
MAQTSDPSAAQRATTRILKLAGGQRRLVTRAQARECGLSGRQIRYRVRSGQWTEPRPLVYCTIGKVTEWKTKVLAVVLSIPGAVASHKTALWLHGVHRLERPEIIEVTAPYGYHRDLPGVLVHQTRSLTSTDTTMVDGIPTTTGERTVIDMAGVLELAERLAVLDEAVGAKAAERGTLHRRAIALQNGRPGLGPIINATRPGAENDFRSWLERYASGVFERACLPAPRWNVDVHDRRGRIGTIDVVFPPGDLVTTELDGLRFHSSAAQQQKDRARDRRLLLAGKIPLRYTYDDVLNRPEEMVSEIRDAIHTAEQRLRDRQGGLPAGPAAGPPSEPSTGRTDG